MLTVEINEVFSSINTLVCMKLSPECNGNEKAMELLNRGKRSFDDLQKVLASKDKTENSTKQG